jgi:hypothetical protein
MLLSVAIVVGAFALGTGAGEAFGATNLGTAMGIGQICFVAALAYLLLSR